MERARLKRKLRDLKRLEIQIRFPHEELPPPDESLVWHEFFTDRTGGATDLGVRYPLEAVVRFTREQRKRAFEEFLLTVYARTYSQQGLSVGAFHNPDFLRVLGLHPGATREDIKMRFRQLAKEHHPDHGGDNEEMLRLLDAVNRLLHSGGHS
jgi:hypothetical protein